jgi:peptidoglycan/LPS O-acetylase OafA/YrhL
MGANDTTAGAAPLPPPPFEYDLEGLRGFAAIVVVWLHFLQLVPAPATVGVAGWLLAYSPPAHLSVLLFFVLSGYVIGRATQRPLTPGTTVGYVKKRLVRLYPIYVVSLLLALAAAAAAYPGPVIGGNLLFLQILLVPIIPENAPAWSLHYEVLCYLLFIPVSLLRLNRLLVVGGSLVAALLCFHWLPMHALPASYAFGFTFWAGGLALAHYTGRLPRLPISYAFLLSILLLLGSLNDFNYLEVIERKILLALIGTDWLYQPSLDVFTTAMSPHDLAYLPYALVTILVFTHRSFAFRKPLLVLLFLLPALTFFGLYRHRATLDLRPYVVSGTSYCAALGLFFSKSPIFERIGRLIMLGLRKAGGLSYALYIIHYPLIIILKNHALLGTATLPYGVQALLFTLLAVGCAYVLEKKFQPVVKAWITT